jgi:hypothetical protein
MKYSRSAIQQKTHAIPDLRFEDQQLTSFSGLVVFQKLFEQLDLKARLRDCFRHWSVTPIFGPWRVVLLLVVHLLLGYRELRHLKYYADDPLVLRLLGVRQLPDVSTVSRTLSAMDELSVEQLERLIHDGVLQRLIDLAPKRVTLDFDGSVIGTGRYAEGTAVGFNRKKKGQRSYYPLFCTVAQTAQVFAVLHRSGNVHDANGAKVFIVRCIEQLRKALPGVILELRMDSAFFSDEIVAMLDQAGVEYTISTPFERFVALKQVIEAQRRWQRLDADSEYVELQWQPKSWPQARRFVLVRRRSKIQHKGPVQLDLFVPYEYGYEFKVVLTNKRVGAATVVPFHNGRGSQEGIFAELKTDNQMDYVPTRTWRGNQVYLLAAVLAHNLNRELHMRVRQPVRTTQPKRPALWEFEQLDTLRKRIIQRAGRLIRPKGKLTLSMSANGAVRKDLLHILDALESAA